MKNKIHVKYGIILVLISLLVQSCATYGVLPNNINHHSYIEGIYSNTSVSGTRSLWDLIGGSHEIKADSTVAKIKIEIIDATTLKITFLENDENIGEKLLKGKFKENECFYVKKESSVVPLFPIIWAYSDVKKRIYQIDNELVIEEAESGGAFLFFLDEDDEESGGHSSSNINYKFKRLDN